MHTVSRAARQIITTALQRFTLCFVIRTAWLICWLFPRHHDKLQYVWKLSPGLHKSHVFCFHVFRRYTILWNVADQQDSATPRYQYCTVWVTVVAQSAKAPCIHCYVAGSIPAVTPRYCTKKIEKCSFEHKKKQRKKKCGKLPVGPTNPNQIFVQCCIIDHTLSGHVLAEEFY